MKSSNFTAIFMRSVRLIFSEKCWKLLRKFIFVVEAQWQDLGMPETLWHCHVKEFGPLIVSIDTEGRNLFEENKVLFNKRKDEATAEICRHVSFIK